MTMLRAAMREGHAVPPRVLLVEAPRTEKSDRDAMSVEQGLACLKVASEMSRGSRWLFTLLYGARMGECLGMTADAIDLNAGEFGEAVIEWQLQPLPYNRPRDRSSGFRVPDGYEARHLVDSYHLVRPKSKSGYRVAPLLEPVRNSLLGALEVAADNPWGLVWPEPNGRPMNDKHDRAEWHALQKAAGVAHRSGRPYHVHECRNFAATMLLEAGVDEHVVTALLGHSTVITSRKYMTVRREPLLDAMRRVGERLQLG
jgi:site-specific recombinase XerD